MKILLLEDEIDLGNTLVRILSHDNHTVEWFTNGTEAWEYLTTGQNELDLAILDWMVPGLSGVEICRQTRQSGRTIPILLLTAKKRYSRSGGGFRCGCG